MKSSSLFERFEIFAASAAVAAHASNKHGFRQREVRFLIELFSNWVETALDEHVLPIQNTQVARYLELLVREGYARRMTHKRAPSYRLTRIGLIELISRMTSKSCRSNREFFFFLFYYIKNYKPRIEALIQEEGRLFPYALKVEIDALLDVQRLVEQELTRVEQDIKRVEARINDAMLTSRHASNALRNAVPVETIVKDVEKLYPYELNSQKPLHELIAGIPNDQREWELVTGNTLRAKEIWEPHRTMLRCYLTELKQLCKNA